MAPGCERRGHEAPLVSSALLYARCDVPLYLYMSYYPESEFDINSLIIVLILGSLLAISDTALLGHQESSI